jgi:hypothetical protein
VEKAAFQSASQNTHFSLVNFVNLPEASVILRWQPVDDDTSQLTVSTSAQLAVEVNGSWTVQHRGLVGREMEKAIMVSTRPHPFRATAPGVWVWGSGCLGVELRLFGCGAPGVWVWGSGCLGAESLLIPVTA